MPRDMYHKAHLLQDAEHEEPTLADMNLLSEIAKDQESMFVAACLEGTKAMRPLNRKVSHEIVPGAEMCELRQQLGTMSDHAIRDPAYPGITVHLNHDGTAADVHLDEGVNALLDRVERREERDWKATAAAMKLGEAVQTPSASNGYGALDVDLALEARERKTPMEGEEVSFEQSTIRCGADGQWTERPGYDHATQEEYESEDRDYPGEKPKIVRRLLKDSGMVESFFKAQFSDFDKQHAP